MKKLTAILCSSQKTLFVIILAFFSAVLVSSMYPTSQAHAVGAVGDGGTGTGGSGAGYNYTHKYGWYVFDTSGSGPSGGFRNGSSWANAQAQCNNIGANQIVAFVYHNSAGNQMIYSWKGENNPVNYKTGPGYISVADAKTRYDQMGGGAPTYVWGTNVGWFCYSSEPPDPPPSGVFDDASCTSAAYGWAFDPSRSDYSIAAHLQIDGDTKIWGFANTLRPDVNAFFSIGGNHGFSFDISSWVSDGRSHTVRVYTYNINSDGAQTNPTSPLLIGEKTVSGCLDYTLTPSINITSSKVVEADSTIAMQPRIDNSGSTDSGSTTQWKLTSFRVAPGSAVPQLDKTPATEYNSGQADPCTFYEGSGVSGCGSAVFTSPNSTASNTGLNVPVPYKLFDPRTASVGDFALGTRICYALSVQPRANDSIEWRYSNPVCVTVGKNPKVQILGGDLWVGVPFAGSAPSASVNTGTVVKNKVTFGSWIEYGIFATGTITGAGSGSAYAGQGLLDATVCKESRLSFTNAANSTGCKDNGSIGNYTVTRSIPDVVASFPKTNTTPTIDSNDISDKTESGIFTASGQLILNGGTLQKGRWLVINAPGADITINGNITYTTDPLQTIYDIPQLVIIARNITIAESVTQVDAWLIAKGDTSGSGGVISTCVFTSADPTYESFPAFPSSSSPPFPDTSRLGLTSNKCSQKLTINGPVMAQKLYLLRTAGSGIGASSGDPAEVINLRPDAYLWANARSIVSGRLQTVYTTELPPRL